MTIEDARWAMGCALSASLLSYPDCHFAGRPEQAAR